MVKYPWNNIFHNYVTNIVTQILEGNYPNAKKSLWEDDFIQDFMLNSIKVKSTKKNPSSDKKFKLGYIGHIKKISKALLSCNSEEIQIHVIESKKWNQFCEEFLNEELEIENRDLGGVRVRQDTNIVEDQFDFSVEEIRSRYNSFLNPEISDKSICSNGGADNSIDKSISGPIIKDDDEIDNNLRQEMTNGKEPIDPLFNEGVFWKSSLGNNYNVDDLLNELI